MLHHLASHLSTLRARAESEEREFEESESEEVTKVSLSHSQRDREAQEEGIMHQVSYSCSVSTFCPNKLKNRNYMSIQQHIFIVSFPFLFQEKNGCPPHLPMLDVIFV